MNQLLGLCDTVMAYKQSQIKCWLLQQDRDARLVGLHLLQGR